jgi:hypothetical protein
VGRLKDLANIATQILSYLKPLVTTLHPHLIQNSIFTCDKHKDKICSYYPISNETNFKHLFIKKTDYIKTKSIQNKLTSRKVLKL